MSYTKTNWQNLPSTTTPLNATNLNHIEQGIYDNDSNITTNTTNIANITPKINNLYSYSTSETQVGTWIDNKPLYRKVIELSALPNWSSNFYNTGISNLKKCILLQCTAISSTGNSFPLPYNATDASGGAIDVVYLKSENQIRITTYMDRSDLEGYAIIYYTKTTD